MPRKKLSIDFGLRTFSARGGKKFLVARLPDGSVEVYAPTNPLAAARACGARGGLIKASALWDSLWDGAAAKKPAKQKKKKAPANGRRKTARKKKLVKRAVKKAAPKKAVLKKAAKQVGKRVGKRRGEMSSAVRQAFGGGRGIVRSGDMMRHLQRRGIVYRPGSVYTLMSALRREHGLS